jgi:type III secretion protein R
MFFVLPSLNILAAPMHIPTTLFNDPFYLLFFLIIITLLPFIAIMTTSFTKIVVVLSIVRQALGTAQAPPNIIIISLAMLLTAFAMYPVIIEIQDALKEQKWQNKNNTESLKQFITISKEPLKAFLSVRAKQHDKDLFLGIISKKSSDLSADDFIILAPAFLISELTHAFQIGFLVYLPFLVIDMTVANILMALGMQMLSPTTISLPFKILLFVLVDGWRLLAEGLTKV